MRKVEYFLIIVVAVFLSVVLPIFNKDNVMDFGNSSDIVSAFGTLGTLAVAFIALRKAPEWMAQKNYDIVSKVIEEAVYEDLRKLTSLSNQYKILIVQTGMILKRYLNAKDELPSSMKETLDKVENSLVDFFNLSYSIQNRLKSVSRYNYVITPYTLNVAEEIKKLLIIITLYKLNLSWQHLKFQCCYMLMSKQSTCRIKKSQTYNLNQFN